MTVNGMLSTLVRTVDDLDPVLIENVWTLAERCGDTATMVSVLERSSALPTSVLDASRKIKDASVRIALLSRTDLPDEERASMLESEKRSDVFAGLIGLANTRPELAARLYAQFKAKPTKVLARVLLRENFSTEDSLWLCLLTLANDKSLSQPLQKQMERVIATNSHDAARVKEMLDVLPDSFVPSIKLEAVSGDNLALLTDRLRTMALAPFDRWDYQARRRHYDSARALVFIAGRQDLGDDVLSILDALSGESEFESAAEVAALLAARVACQETSADDREIAARAATPDQLVHFFDLASTGSVNDVQPFVQGLLENPAAWPHERFTSLARAAKPSALIRAMKQTSSPDLLRAIWRAQTSATPAECWSCVADVESVQLEILRDELSSRDTSNQSSNYSVYGSAHTRITALVEFHPSKRLVAEIPFTMLDTQGYNRWSVNSLLRAAAPAVSELQLEVLGSDPSAWENFNNLASGWSGTLGELLDASSNL